MLSEEMYSFYKVLWIVEVEVESKSERDNKKKYKKANWRKVIKRTEREWERSTGELWYWNWFLLRWSIQHKWPIYSREGLRIRDRGAAKKIFHRNQFQDTRREDQWNIASRYGTSKAAPPDTLNNNKVFLRRKRNISLSRDQSEREQQNYFIINPQGSLDNSTQLILFTLEAFFFFSL